MTALSREITQPVMRYHGGKYRMADWIIGHFPDHRCYVEPFGGAASVLMRKPRAYAEVYNDMDSEIVNVFRCLRDPDLCARLIEQLKLTPYSREEFEVAQDESGTACPIERARRTLFRAQSGFGSAGATRGTTGFRIDSERQYGLSSHLWAKYPDALAMFCDRLTGVIVENRPAVSVIAQHDGPDTLHYVDPPYLWGTRYIGSEASPKSNGRYYRHEMSDAEHEALLQLLIDMEGFVIVSGYMSELYHQRLTAAGWQLSTKEARISAHRGTSKRIECLWMNPQCALAQNQARLI